jgi:hypothetical protein
MGGQGQSPCDGHPGARTKKMESQSFLCFLKKSFHSTNKKARPAEKTLLLFAMKKLIRSTVSIFSHFLAKN